MNNLKCLTEYHPFTIGYIHAYHIISVGL